MPMLTMYCIIILYLYLYIRNINTETSPKISDVCHVKHLFKKLITFIRSFLWFLNSFSDLPITVTALLQNSSASKSFEGKRKKLESRRIGSWTWNNTSPWDWLLDFSPNEKSSKHRKSSNLHESCEIISYQWKVAPHSGPNLKPKLHF